MNRHHLNTPGTASRKEPSARRRARHGLASLAAAAAVMAAVFAGAPAASADTGSPAPLPSEAESGPRISVDGAADMSFSREGTTSSRDTEHQLIQVLGGQTGGITADALSLPLAVPVPSSPFGLRISPINGNPAEFHTGQDFAAACGSPVLAAASGTVTAASWHPGGGGWRMEITHPGGLKTTYNHLGSFAAVQGSAVERGDLIAYAGTTGASTGCHLHFEVWLGGQVTDPAPWL